jgi:hypothetical protein
MLNSILQKSEVQLHKPDLQDMKCVYVGFVLLLSMLLSPTLVTAQSTWTNVTESYGPLPASIKIYRSAHAANGSASIQFYAEIDTKDRGNEIFVDTTLFRRLTPSAFFSRNQNPFIVVNCSFFEFVKSRNVNLVVQDGKMVSFDTPATSRRGRDTLTYLHTLGSAFGIAKRGNRIHNMDIVYQFNDSAMKYPYALQDPLLPFVDSLPRLRLDHPKLSGLKKWKMDQAVGGGPVLINQGKIQISNNEERKFAGKAILDKHPRTAIGYTLDGRIIILAVQGRMKGIADGATLTEMANTLLELGCYEAMNLDGGGSSCLLVNGKETIKPSDPVGQRPIPAALIVK